MSEQSENQSKPKPMTVSQLRAEVILAFQTQNNEMKAILESQKAEIDRLKGQVDSMPKRLEETLESYLKQMQSLAPQPMPMGSTGGLLQAAPDLLRMLGIGGQQSPNADLFNTLQSQFERSTAFMWKQALKDLNKKWGVPEHLDVSDHINLS